jgi:hypothetical protein
VPKKTRRGGRYTTGVRSDGSQTTARRPWGCFGMVIMGVFISGGSLLAMLGAGYLALRGAL